MHCIEPIKLLDTWMETRRRPETKSGYHSQQRLPRWFIEWLDMIPVAILSALIFSDLFVTGSPRQLDVFHPKSMVAIPTFLFARTD